MDAYAHRLRLEIYSLCMSHVSMPLAYLSTPRQDLLLTLLPALNRVGKQLYLVSYLILIVLIIVS